MTDRWKELHDAGWRTDHDSVAVQDLGVRPSWYTPGGKRWGFADCGLFEPELKCPTKHDQAIAERMESLSTRDTENE